MVFMDISIFTTIIFDFNYFTKQITSFFNLSSATLELKRVLPDPIVSLYKTLTPDRPDSYKEIIPLTIFSLSQIHDYLQNVNGVGQVYDAVPINISSQMNALRIKTSQNLQNENEIGKINHSIYNC